MLRTIVNECRHDRISTLRQRKARLRNLTIETSYACNMRCRSCTRTKHARPPFMELGLFRKLVDELAAMRYDGPLGLHYAGEPLLHPEFPAICEAVNQAGLARQAFLYTNGLLLTPERLATLRHNGIRILNVSLDGDGPYVSAYRAPDCYETIVGNLTALRRDFRDAFDVTVHVTLFEQAPEAIDRLIDAVRGLVHKVRITPSLDQATMRFNPHVLFDPPAYDLRDKTCPVVWETMTVLTDGRLNACCFELGASLEIAGVNLNACTVQEALQSEPFDALRRTFLERRFEGNFRVCANCSAWRMGAYNLEKLRVRKLTPGHIVVTNGYTVKHWFR